MSNRPVYFPNLNALRFIGAFAVIIHHIEQNKFLFGFESIWNTRGIFNMGKVGVALFFVLSGFLITSLLLKEREATSSINIKEFYIKRILRIWPLYYLIAALAIFVLPRLGIFAVPEMGLDYVQEGFTIKVILYLIFLPNLAMTMYGALPGANQLWSIGVEEQFYIVWPHIFKSNRNKYLFMFGIIVAYFIFRKMSWLLPNHSDAESITVGFFYGLHFECMAVGGLFSLVYHNRQNFVEGMLLSLFYNKYIQVLSIAAILVLTAVAGKNTYMFIYACFFGVIVLNMATNKRNLFNLENRVTNYLGKISYGLYMYHPIAIILVINSSVRLDIYSQALLYSASILLTIALSHVSFYYFESHFSRLRSKLIKSDHPAPDKKVTLKVVKPMHASIAE